jgi:hypothetical protein
VDQVLSKDVMKMMKLTLLLTNLESPASLVIKQCLEVRLDRIIFLVLALEKWEELLDSHQQEEMELLC